MKAIIVAFIIVASAARYRFHSNETIVVTGLAEKDFVSDLIVWEGSYSRKSMDLKAAYASLKQDESAIRQYLTQKGITESCPTGQFLHRTVWNNSTRHYVY